MPCRICGSTAEEVECIGNKLPWKGDSGKCEKESFTLVLPLQKYSA